MLVTTGFVLRKKKEPQVLISTASTSNKHLFTNLQPGKLYAVRSGAVGSKG
jgi:hypothetical protein